MRLNCRASGTTISKSVALNCVASGDTIRQQHGGLSVSVVG